MKKRRWKVKKFLKLIFPAIIALTVSGCMSDRLPSEDIRVLSDYADIIAVLKNPKIPRNSKEKYEAAKKLIRNVDLHFTRETATVDKLLYHRDAAISSPGSDDPVFTFLYEYKGSFVRLRFFTYKMFVTRVEIVEE